jgi:hypothetical protein
MARGLRCACLCPAAATGARWGAVAGGFEHRLAEQKSTAVAARAGFEVRRGRDYVRVVIAVAADVAEALSLAWQVFRKAAGDETGRDLAGAAAGYGQLDVKGRYRRCPGSGASETGSASRPA